MTVLPAAAGDAGRAAARAGVTIRVLTAAADLRRVAELFARIWEAPDQPPVPHDLLRGYRVTGLAEPGWYLLAAGDPARDPPGPSSSAAGRAVS